MFKKIALLFIPALLFSGASYAASGFIDGDVYDNERDYQYALSKAVAGLSSYPNTYIQYGNTPGPGNPAYPVFKWLGPDPSDSRNTIYSRYFIPINNSSPPADLQKILNENPENVYGATTDELCDAIYGSGGTLLVSDSDYASGSADIGGCSVSIKSDVSFCSGYSNSGDAAPAGSCYLNAEWESKSNGGVNEYQSGDVNVVDDSKPPYLTETDDPSSCSGGSYGSGGKSYCVDTSKVPNANVVQKGDLTPPPSTDTGSSNDSSGSGSTGSDGSTSGDSGSTGGGSGGGSSGGSTGGSGSSGGSTSDGGSTGGSTGGTSGGSTGGDSSSGDTGSDSDSDSGSGSGSTPGSDSSGSGDGDGDGDGEDGVPEGYQTEETFSSVTQRFYGRVSSSPVVEAARISFPAGSGAKSCPKPSVAFTFLGRSINERLELHCNIIDEFSGAFASLFLFLWAFAAYRVFMSA